jgi:hypothetical protein
MSEVDERADEVQDGDEEDWEKYPVTGLPPGREQGSLASRVEARAKELEDTVSYVFPIPTWEDIVSVELRLVGWEALRKIVTKHERQRVPAIRELYVAAEQLLVGTMKFYEVNDSKLEEAETDWITLARNTGKKLPDNLTPRQALIAFVGDTNVAILWQQWQEWMTTRRPEVDEEIGRDFGTTQ